MTIADRIRHYRKQKDLSQSDLANLSDVNLKSLSRYENNTSVPPADILKKLADALQISADALLDDNNLSIQDKSLFDKFLTIQQMEGEDKKMILSFLDMSIRDFKAKQAYS